MSKLNLPPGDRLRQVILLRAKHAVCYTSMRRHRCGCGQTWNKATNTCSDAALAEVNAIYPRTGDPRFTNDNRARYMRIGISWKPAQHERDQQLLRDLAVVTNTAISGIVRFHRPETTKRRPRPRPVLAVAP